MVRVSAKYWQLYRSEGAMWTGGWWCHVHGHDYTSDLVHIEHRGVYQSYINLAFGLGSASGAALGGFLCDRLS